MRVLRLVGAVLLAALAFAAFPAAAASGAETSPATAFGSTATLGLEGQTTFVDGSGAFKMRIAVSVPDPSDTVQVSVYSRLTSRTAFDQAASGRVRGLVIYRQSPRPVSSLPADPGGGSDLEIPVNPSRAGAEPAFYARSGSSVYPVVVQAYSRAGQPLGEPLTTFLVYSAGPTAGMPALAVALTVPVAAPPATGAAPSRLGVSDSKSLSVLASALSAHRDVPVSLAMSPDTLDRLAAGPASDRATLASLASLAAGPDQLLAEPYRPVSASALSAAGLNAELAAQFQAGAATFDSLLHASATPTTEVVPGALDDQGLAAYERLGTQRVVVPDGDLSTLPYRARQTTYGKPTLLEGRGAQQIPVVGADPGLSGMLGPSAQPVLSAEHLLAGLALVQLEAPSASRGLALIAPSGGIDPQVLSTLLGGLAGNPLVKAVTVDDLFRSVAQDREPIVRTLTSPRADPLAGAAQVRAARQALSALAGIAPSEARVLGPLERQMLLATSSVVSPQRRQRALDSVGSAVRNAERGIALPGSSSVTLTARTGTIPLTVLSNPSLDAHVQLRVSSSKLVFRPFSPPGGHCVVDNSSSVTCQLTLTSEATTLRLPVEARTSGVFPLVVTLQSPDGAITLAVNRDTVRSTAFSEVGVVLIVVAGLGLAVWWVRNIRHGRRAHQLVDPPTGEIPVVEAEPDPAGNGDGAEFSEADAEMARFFASPPPRYRPRAGRGEAVSPSRTAPGPNS